MAHAHPLSATSATTAATSQLPLRISAVIERAYRRRDVFPELRVEKAWRTIAAANGTTGIYQVSIERAREVLADAQAQTQIPYVSRIERPRGELVSYGALIRNAAESIDFALQEEARQGVMGDPGRDEFRQHLAAASACFLVGVRVLYWCKGQSYRATIADGFGMQRVPDAAGPYMGQNGQRFDYRPGYMVTLVADRNAPGRLHFAAAHQLTRDDSRPAHLLLIAA